MKPRSEVDKPHQPANPTVVEQVSLIASVAAVAAATEASTDLGGARAPSTPELAIQIVSRVGASGEKPS